MFIENLCFSVDLRFVNFLTPSAMHTTKKESTKISWPAVGVEPPPYKGAPRNVKSISEIEWDKALQPKSYSIFGTHPESRILFLDVNILDSTGNEPFRGDVLIEGKPPLSVQTSRT